MNTDTYRHQGNRYCEVELADEYAGAYVVDHEPGVAWIVLGWEVEADEDTDWSGYMHRTGQLVLIMIGDDRWHIFDADDIRPLAREAYCGECGQIGCCHDGLNRD